MKPNAPTSSKASALLVALTTLCGLVLLLVYQATAPIIAQKKEAILQQGLSQVLPQADSFTTWGVQAGRMRPYAQVGEGWRLFEGRDAQGDLVGWVVEAQGPGYQDPIRLIFGLDPAGTRLKGYLVLDAKETPGLGDRIETDADFLKQFQDLDLSQRLRLVAPGQNSGPSEIEGITGATVSSRAVVRLIQKALDNRLPLIKP